MPTVYLRSRDVPLLKGQMIDMFPFSADVYPSDWLYHLWLMTKERGALRRIFWDEPNTTHRETLRYFLDFFEKKVLLVAMAKATKNIVGYLWYSDFRPQHQAFGGMCMRRRIPHAYAQEVAVLGTEWAFRSQKLQQIWTYSPWKATIKLLEESVNGHVHTVLPRYCKDGDRYRDVYVMRLLPPEE